MKKSSIQLIGLLVALVFIAGVTHAYIAPTGAAGTTNTDGPLTASSTDEAKTGGLAVGTFLAQKNSLFQQNAYFDAAIRGGTPPTSVNAPVKFGDSAYTVDTLFTGALSASGVYQSDTLKTGGGKKPLCADNNGVIYICGQTPPNGPGKTHTVILALKFSSDGQDVFASLSDSIEKDVTVHISAKKGTGSTGLMSYIKNFYTAEAFVTPGVCSLGTSYTPIQSVTIYAGTLSSSEIGIAPGCDSTNADVMITSYSPTTSVKGPIETAGQ